MDSKPSIELKCVVMTNLGTLWKRADLLKKMYLALI